jgi:peroxiredoxin
MTARAGSLMIAVVLGACGPARPTPAGPRLDLRLAALDGGELSLGSLRGRTVVLHLFETGTAAAIPDSEQLAQLAAAEPRRCEVIGVALDHSGYQVVAPWRNALHLRYVIALASDELRAGDGPLGPIRVLPTTVVIDPDGRVAARIERPLRPGELEQVVGPLLAASRQ